MLKDFDAHAAVQKSCRHAICHSALIATEAFSASLQKVDSTRIVLLPCATNFDPSEDSKSELHAAYLAACHDSCKMTV